MPGDARGPQLSHALHDELDVLRSFRDERIDIRVWSFKRKPTFEAAVLDDRKRLWPINRHDPLRHGTLPVLFQEVTLLQQNSTGRSRDAFGRCSRQGLRALSFHHRDGPCDRSRPRAHERDSLRKRAAHRSGPDLPAVRFLLIGKRVGAVPQADGAYFEARKAVNTCRQFVHGSPRLLRHVAFAMSDLGGHARRPRGDGRCSGCRDRGLKKPAAIQHATLWIVTFSQLAPGPVEQITAEQRVRGPDALVQESYAPYPACYAALR